MRKSFKDLYIIQIAQLCLLPLLFLSNAASSTTHGYLSYNGYTDYTVKIDFYDFMNGCDFFGGEITPKNSLKICLILAAIAVLVGIIALALDKMFLKIIFLCFFIGITILSSPASISEGIDQYNANLISSKDRIYMTSLPTTIFVCNIVCCSLLLIFIIYEIINKTKIKKSKHDNESSKI